MKINDLLNPETDSRLRRRSAQPASRPITYSDESSDFTPDPLTTRKPKVKAAKDAVPFEEGPTRGTVRYPPYQVIDEHTLRRMAKFIVQPNNPNDIALYPYRFPYASGKKEFLMKTGRDGFEGE